MHAIEITRTGGPDVLTYVERARPSPGPGEVLITGDQYDLKDASQAHRDLEGRKTHGSTVLTTSSDRG